MRRIRRALYTAAAAAVPLALLAAFAPSAGAAVHAPAFTTPAGGGVVTELVLANGGYRQCVNDYQQNLSAGAKVALYACGNGTAVANQWVTFPDNTFRPYADTNLAMTASAGNTIVLEPVSGSPTTSQTWFYRADGMLVSGTSVAGSGDKALNDPGNVSKNGTQLILFNQGSVLPDVTDNAHFWIKGATFATSTMNPRPDSGGNGNWSNDTVHRYSMLLYMGTRASGSHAYRASVYDQPGSTFSGLAGTFTPNQNGSDAGLKLGDSLDGAMVGLAGFGFNASDPPVTHPAGAYSGQNPPTSTWYELFFTASTTFGGDGIENTGPVAWNWYYTSGKDNCGNIEHWVDAAWNNGGQAAAAGNITAVSGAAC